ncbi:extracellular solute-binding protein [Gordoniibacillus kamchatkensis]|uniref:extracellular solute-binding protein n=1 Tax=Gordoniibacillus kamchatkensis TaxID=1590651 RepID=UPI000B11D467
MRKRTMAVTLASVMLGGLVAGCSGKGGAQDAKGAGAGSQKPITFTWLVYDRPEGKVKTDWEIFKQIEAKTGVKIDWQVVSQEGFTEKRQIMIATNSVTDIIQPSNQEARENGPEKVFLNLKDYLNKAPNLKKFFETYPEAKAVATGADGGIYDVPVLEGDKAGKGFNYIWMVRKDLMDKYNLKPPTNTEEFYQFLKALKQQQPDTFPLSVNTPATGDVGLYTVFGKMFTGITGFFNQSPNGEKWEFAPYNSGYKDALVYMNKLYSEKLLDPEFYLLTGAQWEERFLKGKSSVTVLVESGSEPADGQSEEGRRGCGFQPGRHSRVRRKRHQELPVLAGARRQLRPRHFGQSEGQGQSRPISGLPCQRRRHQLFVARH